MQACMLPQEVPLLSGSLPSPLLHPGLPQPVELNVLIPWQQQQQQQQQQQPAAFVPTAAVDSSSGPGDVLAVSGWQSLASGPAEHLEQQQQQQHVLVAPDDAGKRGRLRWTPQLHAQFVAAVEQLGGAFAATPKRILDVMGVPGITLLQIKSHVQKYRNALGGPGGGKKRGGGGGATRKRSAASLAARGPGSACGGSGACSDAEGEEEGPEALGAAAEHAGGAEREGERSPKRASQAAALPLAAAAAVAGMPAAGPFGAVASEPLLPGWGSEPDLDAIDGELAATLAPAGSLTDSDHLLDMPPEGVQDLDEALSRELSCWASEAQRAAAGPPPPPATDDASEGTAAHALSGAGSDAGPGRSNSGASHVELWHVAATRSAAAAAAAATGGGSTASAATRSGSAAAPSSPALPGGLPSDDQGLLQAALKIQVEMQRQLSSTIEAQRALQMQMEAHGKYIEALLRSEGSLPPKPAPREAARARGGAAARGSDGGSGARLAAHERTQSLRAEPLPAAPCPAEAVPMHRSNSAPAVAEAAEPQQAQEAQQAPAQQAAASAQQEAERSWQEQALLSQQQSLPPPMQQGQQAVQQQPPAPPPALSRLPSWQLQQKFMQQQLELEQRIQQRLAGLQAEAERQRRLLEQQQQREATTAVLSSNDLDLLLLEDLSPAPGPCPGAADAGAAAPQPPPLLTQVSRFSQASSAWACGAAPDAHMLLGGPQVDAGASMAMAQSPFQPASAAQVPPLLPSQQPSWAAMPAPAASGLTGAPTSASAYSGGASEKLGQGCSATAPPPKRQQLPADRPQPTLDVFDSAMWDTLLSDSGVLQQLMGS